MLVSKLNKEFASLISKAVDNAAYTPFQVANELTRDHRYLQNEFGKTAIMFLFSLGEDFNNNNNDARNKHIAALGAQLIELAKKNPDSYLSVYYEAYKFNQNLYSDNKDE